MACLSCAERARLMREGAQKIIKGQSIRPQVSQFGQTIKNDASAAMQRAAAIARARRPKT